jgi:hypothetical protein
MKVDSGRYEIYETDGNGKSRETRLNPARLQPAFNPLPRHTGAIEVWDLFTRLFHWSLVLAFVV